MHRLMNVVLSVGLICAGAYMSYEEIFVRNSGPGSKLAAVGLIFIGSGIVWMWFDFLGPIIIRRIVEKRTKGKNSLLE
jgi:hypothetical protein